MCTLEPLESSGTEVFMNEYAVASWVWEGTEEKKKKPLMTNITFLHTPIFFSTAGLPL